MNETDWKQDDYYVGQVEGVDCFEELPQQIQNDLIEWFNETEPDESNRSILLALYTCGMFSAWDCPECNTRVFKGEPESWDNFQGTRNQNFSYFGNPDKYQQDYIDACCDSCRCHKLC